jgi:NitT/TauT family transport system substrate-binding protein
MWTSYMHGQADGLLSIPMNGLPLAQRSRPSEVIWAADNGIPHFGYGLVAREDTIKNRPQVLARLAQTLERAWRYIYDGHELEGAEAINTARPAAKRDIDITVASLKMYREFVFPPGRENQPLVHQSDDEWSSAMAMQARVGIIKQGHRTTEFYTNDVFGK